jgi:hypothetical protein
MNNAAILPSENRLHSSLPFRSRPRRAGDPSATMAYNDWRSRSCERSEQFVRSPARCAHPFLLPRALPRERINEAQRNVSREGKDRAPQAHRRGAEWLRLVIRRDFSILFFRSRPWRAGGPSATMAYNDWRSRSCERSEQFVRSPARCAHLFLFPSARPRERINEAKRNV